MEYIQPFSKNYNSTLNEINILPQMIIYSSEIIFLIFSLIFSFIILKFKETGRKYLIFSLIVVIVIMILDPIINFVSFPIPKTNLITDKDEKMLNFAKVSILLWSYVWTLIVTGYFGYLIWKFTRKEVKELFN